MAHRSNACVVSASPRVHSSSPLVRDIRIFWIEFAHEPGGRPQGWNHLQTGRWSARLAPLESSFFRCALGEKFHRDLRSVRDGLAGGAAGSPPPTSTG